MASTPMYDMIMDLPLFKGVSRLHISNFLEKTPLNFEKYTDGDTIVDYEEEIDRLRFVIQGEVAIHHKVDGGKLILSEQTGKGAVIGADRLFGIVTNSNVEVKAIGEAGIMSFSKDDYMTLLSADKIYLINYLNYLSMRVQRAQESLAASRIVSLGSVISRWRNSLCLRNSKDLSLRIPEDEGGTLFDIMSRSEIEDLEREGMITISSDMRSIEIKG